jgi:hypothetical protein
MSGPIEDDINLAAAIGRVSGAWSRIESQLTLIFCALAIVKVGVGAAIFDFFKSTATHSQVLTKLGKLSPVSNDLVRAALKSAIDDYGHLAKERNELAHNPLGWTSPERSEVYMMMKSKVSTGDDFPWTTKPLVISDIDALKDRIDLLNFKLVVVMQTISPLPPMPEQS